MSISATSPFAFPSTAYRIPPRAILVAVVLGSLYLAAPHLSKQSEGPHCDNHGPALQFNMATTATATNLGPCVSNTTFDAEYAVIPPPPQTTGQLRVFLDANGGITFTGR